MSISNEQIVLSLITYYKNRGIDMAGLLADPVFHQLKLEDKIEAIKSHAQTIVNHSVTPEQMDKGMKRSLAADTITGSLGGLLAGATASKLATTALQAANPLNQGKMFTNRPAFWKATALAAGSGAILGAVAGLGSSYLRAVSSRNHRQTLLEHLNQTVKDPSNTNAVGVLSTHFHPNRSNPILNKITNWMADKVDSQKDKALETLPHNWVAQYEHLTGESVNNYKQ